MLSVFQLRISKIFLVISLTFESILCKQNLMNKMHLTLKHSCFAILEVKYLIVFEIISEMFQIST